MVGEESKRGIRGVSFVPSVAKYICIGYLT